MNNYGIHIQYDGTRYSGWQKQGNTQNTIQGKIETVLEKMTDSKIEIHGSDVPMPVYMLYSRLQISNAIPQRHRIRSWNI